MIATRHLALSVYSALTAPMRSRLYSRRLARRKREGTVPVCVLFYHRVADWCPNDWTMPTRTFEKQIAWLKQNFEIVPLDEAQRRVASGRNDRPTVCITFDDGYADNFDFAVPLLHRDRIPFTYFVATQNVLKNQPFPHDAAAGQYLRPNGRDELELLVRIGAEIGSHSRTHANLAETHGRSELEAEIVQSKRELEDAVGQEVRYFAFPYGLTENLSQEAFRMAHRAGYAGVCSAYGAYNFPGGDPFHIRRIHGDPEFVRLKRWLMLDGRKLRQREVFDPGNYQAHDEESNDGEEWNDECRNPNEVRSPNEETLMTK